MPPDVGVKRHGLTSNPIRCHTLTGNKISLSTNFRSVITDLSKVFHRAHEIEIVFSYLMSFNIIMSVYRSVLVFSVLVCFGCSDSHQELIQAGAAAEKKDINHGCPSWFVPISNDSNRCKCGEPIHHPARLVYCNPYTNQTQV